MGMKPELLNLGKDYPQGFDYFRPRLHRAFMANAHLRDEEEIRKGIARADFVRKGMYSSCSGPQRRHTLSSPNIDETLCQ